MIFVCPNCGSSLGIPIERDSPSNTDKCLNKDCQYKYHSNTNLFEFYCCKACFKNKGHGQRCERVNIDQNPTSLENIEHTVT